MSRNQGRKAGISPTPLKIVLVGDFEERNKAFNKLLKSSPVMEEVYFRTYQSQKAANQGIAFLAKGIVGFEKTDFKYEEI